MVDVERDAARAGALRRLGAGALLLGVAAGGFFDGILLHQILQWHHLLSGVAPQGAPGDLRFQILADGLFHAAHYLAAAIGLALMWRARAALGEAAAARRLAAMACLGFGAWHILDAALAHWLLGLHRIRMDATAPLMWDLAWLAPFGLLPAAVGLRLLRRGGGGGPGRGARALAMGLASAALLLGVQSARAPAAPEGWALVVLRPGLGPEAILSAAEAVGGRLAWSDAGGGVWLIALGEGARPSALYRHGALLVSQGAVVLGCLSAIRA